ncbi:MAG: ABC transporter ATP-binding protein [Magnetococcales bacterium]|nr:ABC transporter ATP-binding protein [Magnetococcales bacterium]MBF0155992.1 ABC transporter ATP-binding protein [Magnetococcales bacterium]
MPQALQIQALDKRYRNGVMALKGIDLTIPAGEFFAILGPNGAGKSTLINIVAQVTRKSAGRVMVFGVDIDREPERAKRLLGFTPQEIGLDPFFTVREVLENHSGYYGIADNRVWIETLIDKLGLTEQADRVSRQLSGGMKRRLTVAKALVHKPRLLILDEPTAGVDVALRHGLWDFVRELHRQGTTIILTTHYLEEAQELAERVAILRAGETLVLDRMVNLLAAFGTRRCEIHLAPGRDRPPLPPGLSMAADGGTLVGELAGDQLRELFPWLSRHSAEIVDFRIQEPSLEDVFLRLVRGSHHPAANASGGDRSGLV